MTLSYGAEMWASPLKLLNSFDPSSRWLLTASGGRDNAIPFLDLSVNIVANKLHWETYRKDLNGYLYVPRVSCHPEGTFRGLVKGEAMRLLRTNRRPADFAKHAQFF